MEKTVTILGFGASSMQGVGDSQGGFFRRLGPALEARGRRAERVNLGVAGDTTRDMLARLGQAEAHKSRPCLTLVLLGCNDLPRAGEENPKRVPLPEYRRNLERIFAALRSERNLFVSSFHIPDIDEGLFAAYMEAAREAAVGYGFWDLFRDSRPRLGEFLAADRVHYNDAGHAYLAEEIAERLAPLLPGGD